MKKEWVSRFQIWPYLERFAEDSIHELTSEFHGDPDLIIGNYSDGNLVSSLLSDHFGSIQCTIAHALEKPKYHLSDVYWQEKETGRRRRTITTFPSISRQTSSP
jgi:sucrose synthase